jgi:hypothetical protein
MAHFVRTLVRQMPTGIRGTKSALLSCRRKYHRGRALLIYREMKRSSPICQVLIPKMSLFPQRTSMNRKRIVVLLTHESHQELHHAMRTHLTRERILAHGLRRTSSLRNLQKPRPTADYVSGSKGSRIHHGTTEPTVLVAIAHDVPANETRSAPTSNRSIARYTARRQVRSMESGVQDNLAIRGMDSLEVEASLFGCMRSGKHTASCITLA